MRLVTLFLIAAFAAPTVGVGSYQKIDGTIVDPITDKWGEVCGNCRRHLEPDADLPYAHLSYQNLSGANLFNARLYGANLGGASLYRAYQDGADLSYSHLYKANLSEAYLGGADPLSLTGSGIRCFFVASDAKVNRLGDSRIWRP